MKLRKNMQTEACSLQWRSWSTLSRWPSSTTLPSSFTSLRVSTSIRSKRLRRPTRQTQECLARPACNMALSPTVTWVIFQVCRPRARTSKAKTIHSWWVVSKIRKRQKPRNSATRSIGSTSFVKCSTSWCSWSPSPTAFSTNTCRTMLLTLQTKSSWRLVSFPRPRRWTITTLTGSKQPRWTSP